MIRICLYDSKSKNGVGWSGKLPICEPKCSVLKRPKNGIIACSDNNLVGSKCKYTCDKDFGLRGRRVKICESRNETISKWDDETLTTCNPLCTAIDNLKNGSVNCTGRAEGDFCEFSCDESFNIIGYRNDSSNSRRTED